MTQRRTGAGGPWDEARAYDRARARGQGQSRARVSGAGGGTSRQPGGRAARGHGGGSGSGCALWPLLALVLLCALLGGAFAWRTTPLNALGTTSTRKLVSATFDVQPGTYAFMRGGQVWLGRVQGIPRALTNFSKPDRDPTHWGPFAWAPDTHHLAVAIGPPIVAHDHLGAATGTLYLVDAHSGATTPIAPRKSSDPGVAVGPNAYAWADAHTLLFAAAGKLLAYDVAAGTTTPLPGVVGLAVDMEVRGTTLYYTSYAQPDGPLLIIGVSLRRHDLATNADSQLADLGPAQFEVTGCNDVGCEAAAGVPSLAPAWDVSLDGTRLAYEQLGGFAADLTTASATFWYATLATTGTAASAAPTATTATGASAPASASAAPRAIFHGVPSTLPLSVPGACCYLRFGPDGRGLVLSSGYAMPSAYGPYLLYTNALAQGYQMGSPWAFGPAAWSPDASAFTLVVHRANASTTDLLTYGNKDTAVLQDDAYDCAWAYLPGSA